MVHHEQQQQPEPVDLDYLSIKIDYSDASFILSFIFVIFTTQTGFSLLQSGFVRRKNQVTIMLMTTFNPIITGLTYWILAYALTETSSALTTPNEFIGLGSFLADSIAPEMGQLFASYTFRLSTMLTASNVLLGACAERISFIAYFLYLTAMAVAFALPSYWVSSSAGFLHRVGAVDIAGCSFIHLAGGTAGLVATVMLRPRSGRFDYPLEPFEMCDPTNALLGTYMLWWGWVGFHMSATFGVSNNRWMYCTRSAICTIISSAVGGVTAILFSYFFHNKQINVKYFVCGLFAGMVAISGGCTLFTSAQAVLVGLVGSVCSLLTVPLLRRAQIDDPVHSIAIHMASSVWGLLAVGLLADRDALFNSRGHAGLFMRGGSAHLLGAQIAAVVAVVAWSALASYLSLKAIATWVVPIRVDLSEEESGLDMTLNKINTDADWDKILSPNPDPTKPRAAALAASKASSRRKLAKVITAIMAVNRLMAGKGTGGKGGGGGGGHEAGGAQVAKFSNQLKAYNTKVLAQSWSSVMRPGGIASASTSTETRIRPMYTEPHR